MAYDAEGLQAYARGGALGTLDKPDVATLYHYTTDDADTVVEADNYFDNTALKLGDVVIASVDLDGTPEVKVYIVSVGTGDIDSNDVTVVPMLIA